MKNILVILVLSIVQLTSCRPQHPVDHKLKNFTWKKGISPSNNYRYNLAFSVADKIYVVGGDNGGAFEEYDFKIDSWRSLKRIPTARSFPTGAIVDSSIYVIGGISDSLHYLATVEKYSLRGDNWSVCEDLPKAISRSTSVSFNGKIYVFGGHEEVTKNKDYKNSALVHVYDPQSDSWIRKTDMPTPRHGHSAVVVKDKILVVGGYTYGPTGIVEEYDPVRNKWTTKESMPTPRGFLGLVTIEDYVYAIAGRIWNDKGPLERYDIENDRWIQLEPIPARRQRFGITTLNDKVYLIGSEHNPKSVLIGEIE